MRFLGFILPAMLGLFAAEVTASLNSPLPPARVAPRGVPDLEHLNPGLPNSHLERRDHFLSREGKHTSCQQVHSPLKCTSGKLPA
jgi:hypothetical protein